MTQYRITVYLLPWAKPPHRREVFSEDLPLLQAIVSMLLRRYRAARQIDVHDMGDKGVPVLLRRYPAAPGERLRQPHPEGSEREEAT